MTRVDEPPSTSASDVLGSRLENVAASDGAEAAIPFSSTNIRRRRPAPEPNTSELMSPRRLRAEPGASESEERKNRALLLLGAFSERPTLRARLGEELEA